MCKDLCLRWIYLPFEALQGILRLVSAVKQRAAVRATWTPVIPQTKVRGVAPQPWPTAPHRATTPQKKVPEPRPLRRRRSLKFHCITPSTNPAPPQPLAP